MAPVLPDELKEQIRDRNDIVEVIGSYLQLKKAGGTWKALCPFHKEKTPSFNVDQRRQIFHCFGCGQGGDVFSFVMRYEGVDFPTSLRLLAQRVGLEVEFQETKRKPGEVDKELLFKLHDQLTRAYQVMLEKSPGAQAARDYLAQRNFPEDLITAWQLGYAPEGWDTVLKWGREHDYKAKALEAAGLVVAREDDPSKTPYDRFRDRLMFPLHDELGRVIGFSGRVLNPEAKGAKYVNSPETMLFKKSRVLFGMDKARHAVVDARQVIMCEGQTDVMRCHQHGITNAVAALGTAITEDHARILKRYADEVVLVLDADTAGENAALRAAEIFLAAGLSLRIASLPVGEDPDSLIDAKGPEAFSGFIEQALPILDFQIKVLQSREDPANEAGLMRVTKAVVQTINRASSAVQRDRMIQRASGLLGVSEDALRQDSAAAPKVRPPRSPEAKPAPPREHAREEVDVVEVLLAYPETRPLAQQYLPPDSLCDATCRIILETTLRLPDEPIEQLMPKLSEQDPEAGRIAAQAQMNSREISRDTWTPEMAMQNLILLIRRKALERQRQHLIEEAASLEGTDRQAMEYESLQLKMVISHLKEAHLKHDWHGACELLESY